MVGERGPELVNLPQGSSVIPNNQMTQVSQQPTYNITIQAGALMGNGVEARKFAQMIVDNVKDIAASKNMTVQGLLS